MRQHYLRLDSRFLQVLFSLIAMAAFGQVVASEKEPYYFYKARGGPDQTFATPSAALEGLKAYYAQKSILYPPPYSQQRALSMRPNPASDSFNNHPITYLVEMQSAEYGGPWSPSYFTDAIDLNVECTGTQWEIGQDRPRYNPTGEDYYVYCKGPTAAPPRPPEPSLCPKGCGGNPIYFSTGLKLQRETDYQGVGSNALFFQRIYRSDRGAWGHNYERVGLNFNGVNTRRRSSLVCSLERTARSGRAHCFNYIPTGSINSFIVARGDGQFTTFGSDSGVSPNANVKDRLTRRLDVNGNLAGWSLYNAGDESTEFYDLKIRLMTITDRHGRVTTLTYSDETTPAIIAPEPDMLLSVTDAYGRSLQFTYDMYGRMISMTDPANEKYVYSYNGPSAMTREGREPESNLTSVTYPDMKARTYWYNEPGHTAGADHPYALTGITDENGIRFATFKYDAQGKAVSTEHAGSVEKFVVGPAVNGVSVVSNPLGNVTTYEFSNVAGRWENTRQVRAASPGIPAAEVKFDYDANSNIKSSTDWNGVATTFTYDMVRNLEKTRTEAAGTPEARTITTDWHPTFRLPVTVAEPKLITTFSHDPNGSVLSKTEQATSDETGAQGLLAARVGMPRRWVYTYNAVGQIKTEDGPRTDVLDITTYDYDLAGNIERITNGVEHVTKIEDYDQHGRPRRIVAPNKVVTTIDYSPRGWTRSTTTSGQGAPRVTTYDHDDVGQVIKVTYPDGSFIRNVYDDAHRLTDIYDGLGNTIHYELDVMGNRLEEHVKDANGALTRKVSRKFDILSRIKELTGAAQ